MLIPPGGIWAEKPILARLGFPPSIGRVVFGVRVGLVEVIPDGRGLDAVAVTTVGLAEIALVGGLEMGFIAWKYNMY